MHHVTSKDGTGIAYEKLGDGTGVNGADREVHVLVREVGEHSSQGSMALPIHGAQDVRDLQWTISSCSKAEATGTQTI